MRGALDDVSVGLGGESPLCAHATSAMAIARVVKVLGNFMIVFGFELNRGARSYFWLIHF